MPEQSKSSEEWGQDFDRVRGHFSDFTKELHRLVEQLLDANNIQVAQLEARTKTVRSFSEKLDRKNEKYSDPLVAVTDLTALRIILYYQADVAIVGELIEEEFEIDWENSQRQDAAADPERFSYRSDQYVIRVAPERCKLSEWKRFKDDRAEIQVRTVMQHAWAAVDHQIRYKRDDLPKALQRRLARLSAVLEGADEEFTAIKVESETLAGSYEASVERGDLRVALDALSLRAYLDQTNIGVVWAERAHEAGFSVWISSSDNEAGQAVRTQELLEALQHLGVSTLKEYEQRLRGADRWGRAALAAISDQLIAIMGASIMPIPEWILLMLTQIESGDPELVDAANWHPAIAAAIKAAFSLGPRSQA